MRSLLLALLCPGLCGAVEVYLIPKVAPPIGAGLAAAVAPRLAQPLALAPALILSRPPALVAPKDILGPAPVNRAQEVMASVAGGDEGSEEHEALAGRALFDRGALKVDGLDAVAAPGLAGSVAATGRGVRLRLADGHAVKLSIVGETRIDSFSVWKDKKGYRVKRQGMASGHAVPDKGFFIMRGPAAAEGRDRLTIVDPAMKEPRPQAALSVEDGGLVIQDLGSMSIRDGSSVLISGARAEGPFPIEKVMTPAGHAFARGAIRYRDETVAVDWDSDPALRGFYERVRGRLSDVKGGELEALAAVFDSVLREVRYDEAELTSRIARLEGRRGVLLGELMGLSDDKTCPAVGVCRHTALLLGAVLERLIQEGEPSLRGGKAYYVGGKGHAWAVYRDATGGYHVLDAAQNHRVVALTPETDYAGEVLDGKGRFSYADDMAPELKREWREGFPSRLRVAAEGLGASLASAVRRALSYRTRRSILKRRLAEIRDGR